MKIKLTAIFLAIFALTSATAFAAAKTEKKTSLKIAEKKDPADDLKIQPFDFQKLFSEAETYFKAAKAWERLRCEPKSGFLCTKRECPKREVKAFIVLDKKAKTVTRCESEICETFPATFNQTGVFYNIQSDGPIGTLIRVLGDSRYKEITTVGLDAYIANGNCEVISD
ncbi:MAG: hypothetical protein V4694_02415 [Pseudomonadota bacterium]